MNARHAAERQKEAKADQQREVRLIGSQRLIPVGCWEWNLETKKYSWCDEMYRIFNVTRQQFSLRTGTFFNCVHPTDRNEVVKAFGKALVGEQPYNIRHRIIWPDGSVRFVHGKAEVTFAEGRPTRFCGTIEDITARRRVEPL